VKHLFRSLFGHEKPPAALPRRCRWERVPAGVGREEWAIVCPPESEQEGASSLRAEAPSTVKGQRSSLSSAQGLLRRSAPRNDVEGTQPWAVLYLLHGSGHSPLSYFRQLPMESMLPMAAGVCLVFAEGHKGWYLDSPMDAASQGEQAFLRTMEFVESRYPAGGGWSKRGICGFSMGGFGAMHLASRHPDLFGSASSLIGPLDIEQLWPDHEALRRLLGPDREVWRAHNPAAQAQRLSGVALLASTAEGAWDRPLNQSFVEACRSQGVEMTYRQHPGEHGTEFVAAHLREHLEFHVRALGGEWFIRPARVEDAGALWHNCFANLGEEGARRHLAWALDETAQCRRLHLVVDMGEAVASGELSIVGDRAEIANLAVQKTLQGQGLGTALMEELTRLAAARGIHTLEIGVRTADQRTRALYERQGFAPFRETMTPIGGESVLVTYLRKRLADE